MKKLLSIAAVSALLLAGCAQGAVRGQEAGWAQVSESSAAVMDSGVTYLGASADGLIIVQMADGTVEIWGN